MQKHTRLLVLTLLMLLTACSGVEYMRYNERTFPPTDNVDVYRTISVDRDYIELGELEVQEYDGELLGSPTDAIIELKKAAKEIGADAIIIVGNEYVSGKEDSELFNRRKKYLRAVAIRYK